jgi:fermentation-respiration switch protein FrsA (DUF1100 family)
MSGLPSASMNVELTAHRLFGIEIRTRLHLPGAWGRAGEADMPSVELVWTGSTVPAGAEQLPVVWETVIDDRPLRVGSAGAVEFVVSWGDACHARLRADDAVLEWTGADPGAEEQRFLLDTVAYLVALALGREALHAATVVVEGDAIAVAARSGMGKSTLAAALLCQGATLLSDDITVVGVTEGEAVAHPGAPLMTLPAGRTVPEARTIAIIGDEAWSEVRVVPEPRRLRALVLLERAADADHGLEPVPPSALSILPWLLAFPRSRERERERFELASRLAERIPIIRYRANRLLSPGALADHLLDNLDALAGGNGPRGHR